MPSPRGEAERSRKWHSRWVPTTRSEGGAQPRVEIRHLRIPLTSRAQSKGSPPAPVGPRVNEMLAGTGVPFPGNNNLGESMKQSWHLSWLQNDPSLDFHFTHLPLKRGTCAVGVTPRSHGGLEHRDRPLLWKLGFSGDPPPAGSGGSFVHRLRILHAPLGPVFNPRWLMHYKVLLSCGPFVPVRAGKLTGVL